MPKRVKKLLNVSMFLVIFGTIWLMTYQGVALFLSVCLVLVGQIMFLYIGKMYHKLEKFLLVDACLVAVLTGYYFIFKEYNIGGIVHFFIVAFIVGYAYGVAEDHVQ